jgi:hypothetical protein
MAESWFGHELAVRECGAETGPLTERANRLVFGSSPSIEPSAHDRVKNAFHTLAWASIWHAALR